jgi:hypothetical protein
MKHPPFSWTQYGDRHAAPQICWKYTAALVHLFDCMSARHTHSIVNSVHGANDSNNNVKEIKLNRMLTVS